MAIPQNVVGFQNAKEGNGYVGFFAACNGGNSALEFIQVKLKSKLEKGKSYCLSFFINLSDSSEYGIDRIGAIFTSIPIFGTFALFEQLYFPQIESPEDTPFTNKEDWEMISGEICGSGTEEFLTIGNFRPNLNSNFYPAGNGGPPIGNCAYYFIDVVELIPCGICAGYVPELPDVLTPNGDGVNDEFVFEGDGNAELHLFIYNRWGAEVYAQKGYGLEWNGRSNNGTRLTDGVYFYVIEGNGIRKSGTVSLFH